MSLSSSSRSSNRTIPWVGLGCFGVLLALNLFCWGEWWVWQEWSHTYQARVQAFEGRHRGLTQDMPDRVAALPRIMTAQRFGWSVFLSRLEGVLPPKVSIEQILPRFDTGEIQLQGYAVGELDLVEFLTRLRASPYFTHVPPVPAEQRWTPEGLLTFPVTFHYRMDEGEARP